MPGLVYHLNVYRLRRGILALEEHIRIMEEILERIPIDTAKTRHALFKERIDLLKESVKLLRQRYSQALRLVRE